MDNPCTKSCPDRSPTCHSECVAYLAFFKERQEERERRREHNQLMHDNEFERRFAKLAERRNHR